MFVRFYKRLDRQYIQSQRRWILSSNKCLLQGNKNATISPLRRAFDDQDHWEESQAQNTSSEQDNKGKNSSYFWSRSKATAPQVAHTGLFQNPYLNSPEGLRKFANKSLTEATALVRNLREDSSQEGLVRYIIRLDQLSDILCRVIDLCEFLRAAHPDEQFVAAAQECHEQMFEIMNILNTDVVLCKRLKQVLSDENISSKLSSEEIRVGHILLEDFEKAGAYASPEVRKQFIQLSQNISIIGQDFINNTESLSSSYIKIPCKDLESSGTSHLVLRQLTKDTMGNNYKIPTSGYAPYTLLNACPSEAIRRQVWTAMFSCSEKQVKRLKSLLQLRRKLANIMGATDYVSYQLEGKMAKSPENVKNFLNTLVDHTKPLAAGELEELAKLKRNVENLSETNTLKLMRPWDRDYYSSLSPNFTRPNHRVDGFTSINTYFSLGVVMQGISDLFRDIYGISLKPVVAQAGETWAPDVRKLQVISETEGIIGLIYCDLLERPGKTTSPSHFTVCCSRQIYPEENDFSTIQVGENPDGSRFQMPVISLICNFRATRHGKNKSLCLLELSDVETLFHEMGHALHSMLGRTQLQNLSGTRCVTDFVELPSILMEHFAKDRRVLLRISSNYATGEPIPEELLSAFQEQNNFLKNTETFSQIKMSMLDQRLHSITDQDDIIAVYHGLEREMEVLVDDQTNWCGRFGHLFGYGASYYSYLMDRAIAAKIWDHLFKKDPFSRSSGEKFKEGVLKWGGSRDAWQCIADALDEPRLVKGDDWAMRFIGEVEDM
ncbi:AFR198Wp [Eremothecium gossypii ATCC 10895]|uniref:Mitochondrial intermediate peptidase n=1 Tax=Eremothecium gossypii (strain ATCC 10895 / CBS 109.51 / FGSC 9923 / NRRL Y-1056) TaxID=284811 RepID=PMIP_EREGS|nr:AFR198Wp [Eremothecium gossypii ATCC 10895]Q753X4.1 RecName: Full=Mitochondrial intermediate peptidase; Short=MIP; AltName: Full=Octapeptidyl aminopeptidase; Flags: Precursor [Eremothecium gossypii ATCC 10895]AAS53569.1 AFR198Wp [Eremothecium gossypii ATCC 10895]AEY97882.1 FAFR198Wp [Eremothecium gossypii FDAG1]